MQGFYNDKSKNDAGGKGKVLDMNDNLPEN